MTENQTQFSYDEPLREDVFVPQGEPIESTEKKPFFKDKKKLAIIGVCLLVIMLLLIIFTPKRRDATTPETVLPADVIEVEKTGFDKRISDLEAELELADPSDSLLPFPAVDMGITLENQR